MKILFLLFFFSFNLAQSQEKIEIFFDSNSDVPNITSTTIFNTWMNENPNVEVLKITGHCDATDSSSYNKGLASRRIKSIIENKVNDFRNFIDPYAYLLGDQYESFFDYWTESNQKNGKLRWEDQKFFNIERRIATWMSNNKKYNNNGNSTGEKLGTSAARLEALRNW